MNKVKYFFKNLLRSIRNHKADIYTALGIGGTAGAIIWTAKVAPKVKEQTDKMVDTEDKVMVWLRNYAPVGVMWLTSSGLILYSNKLRAKQFAELASAYAAAKKDLGDIPVAIAEEVGIETAKNIKEKLVEKKLGCKSMNISDIPVDRNGEIRCYDEFSGRYFYSTIENLRKIQNDMNAALLRDEMVFMNDYFDAVHLERLGYGDALGWHLIKGVYEMFELDMTTVMADEEGNPCLLVSLVTPPIMIADSSF